MTELINKSSIRDKYNRFMNDLNEERKLDIRMYW